MNSTSFTKLLQLYGLLHSYTVSLRREHILKFITAVDSEDYIGKILLEVKNKIVTENPEAAFIIRSSDTTENILVTIVLNSNESFLPYLKLFEAVSSLINKYEFKLDFETIDNMSKVEYVPF